MTVWFTADLHLGHENMIGFCNRPFDDADQMDDAIITVWRETVRPCDQVYFLGDFSFHHTAERHSTFLKHLPGNKVLIKGNHDSSKLLKKTHGWGWVKDYHEIKVGRAPNLIVLCHYAFETWHNSHHGAWHLHGHSHGTLPPRGRRMDVGIDCLGFDKGLICLEEVEIYMQQREVAIVDCHGAGR
jgi:calcineurin-like phosphoesterase family protein